MLKLVSALAVGHLQGAHSVCIMYSLCFNLWGRNSTAKAETYWSII